MKKSVCVGILAALWLFINGSPAAVSAAGLPTEDHNGQIYYDVTSKAQLDAAVQYGFDQFTDHVRICYDASKRDWTDAYANDVRQFTGYLTKGVFTYAQYAVAAVSVSADEAADSKRWGSVEIEYLDTPAELAKADAKIEEILAAISADTLYDKLLYIANYVCRQAQYGAKELPGGGYDAINGVYDVLNGVRTNTVCTSYALTFQRFMEKAGIHSYILSNVEHAFNIVELDGAWYGVDCTQDLGETISMAYFLMGRSAMRSYSTVQLDPLSIFAKSHTIAANSYRAATPSKRPPTHKATATKTVPPASPSRLSTAVQTTTSAPATIPSTTRPMGIQSVDVSGQAVVPGELFDKARENGQTLQLIGNGYTWTFSSEALAASAAMPASFDARIVPDGELTEEDRAQLNKLAGETPYIAFRFAHHGALPGRAAVSLPLTKAYAGKTVNVYTVSDAGEAVLETEGSVTADGRLLFETDHCSLWFITEKGAPLGGAGGHTWVWILSMVLLAAAAGGGGLWFGVIRKRRLPADRP